MADLNGLDLCTLKMLRTNAVARYESAIKEKKDDDQKTALAELKQIGALIKPLEEVKPDTSDSTTSNWSQLQSTFRTIDSCVDKIPVFSPGMEVQSFLRQVGTASFLAGTDPLAVNHLIKRLVTRLCDEYAQIYTSHVASKPINTIDAFKKFFSSTFETKKSVFQIMQSIDTWARKSTETHRDYANRIRHDLHDLTDVVKAKWKAAKKEENSSFNGEMDVDDLFRLIGGMVLLRDVAKDQPMFEHCITRIDKATDATGIASVVMAYSDRKQTTDPVLSSVGEVNLAQKRDNPDSDRDVCFDWKRDGECAYRDNCQWKHPPKFKKVKPDQSQKGHGQNGQSQRGRGGNRYNRGRGGKKYHGRKQTANSKQSTPGQAHHVEAEQNFGNAPLIDIDAFAGAGFQH